MDVPDRMVIELLLQTFCWICQRPLPSKCPWCPADSSDCTMKFLETSYGYRVAHQHCWDRGNEAFTAFIA